MSNHIEHRGFFKQFDKVENKLIIPVKILPTVSKDKRFQDTLVELKALWDTGATKTCIRPDVKDLLSLRMFRLGSPIVIAGVGGMVKADFTIITIRLTDNLEIEDCPVYVLDFPKGFDIIIGMDIIGMGDFAVSNVDNRTSFSFVTPPFPDRINFVERIEANKK